MEPQWQSEWNGGVGSHGGWAIEFGGISCHCQPAVRVQTEMERIKEAVFSVMEQEHLPRQVQ